MKGPVDAMILAAGRGTRLRPITDTMPKALVTVGGVPMLERIARRLIEAGVDRLVVNVHHHADQIRSFLDERQGFGIDVRVSEEPEAPLETGGGLLAARDLFRGDRPIFVHNVDIITEAPLVEMMRAHEASGALVTLAVSDRSSSRLFRFDRRGLLGHFDARRGTLEAERAPEGETRDHAFAGIHVISPDFFDLVEERGAFSILEPYVRLAGAGHRILPFHIADARWLEIGNPERLEAARRAVGAGPRENDA